VRSEGETKMMKAICCVLVCLVLVSATDITKDEKTGERLDAAKKRMAAKGVKDLDLSKLKGKWFEIAGSSALHESFLKDCRCNAVEFHKLSDAKVQMRACCKGKDNKDIKVNGTLTQTKENASIFQLEFTGKKGDVKGVNVNKTEAREVSSIKSGDRDNIEHENQKHAGTGNVVMLRVSKNYDSIVMASPALDAAWILARKPQLDDKCYDEYVKFLGENGFTATKLAKISRDKCEDK